MTNQDSILKSRDISLPAKIHIVKAVVFPVVIYSCESWTVKKAEHWRIDTFELWCWWRLLRASWIARRSNQSILKEINPEYSLEGLILKLQFLYKQLTYTNLTQTVDSLKKTSMLGKTEGKGKRGRQRMRWLDSITDSTDRNFSKLREIVEDRGSWHAAVHPVARSQTLT